MCLGWKKQTECKEVRVNKMEESDMQRSENSSHLDPDCTYYILLCSPILATFPTICRVLVYLSPPDNNKL